MQPYAKLLYSIYYTIHSDTLRIDCVRDPRPNSLYFTYDEFDCQVVSVKRSSFYIVTYKCSILYVLYTGSALVVSRYNLEYDFLSTTSGIRLLNLPMIPYCTDPHYYKILPTHYSTYVSLDYHLSILE